MGDVFRTCGAHELEGLTRNGWELHDTREEQWPGGGESYTDYVPQGNGGYPMSVCKTHPGYAVSKLVFVLRKDRDEEMTTLRAELALAQEVRVDAVNSARADADGRTKAEQRCRDLEATLDHEGSARVAAEKGLADRDSTMRKWEGDFAKIRKEIGEARFREILGLEK